MRGLELVDQKQSTFVNRQGNKQQNFNLICEVKSGNTTLEFSNIPSEAKSAFEACRRNCILSVIKSGVIHPVARRDHTGKVHVVNEYHFKVINGLKAVGSQ